MSDGVVNIPGLSGTISAAAAYDLGVAARQADDHVMAMRWLRQALAVDPSHRDARIELATVLRERGQPDAAEAEYRIMLAERPSWYFPRFGLGLCARMRGDLSVALDHFAAAMQAAPGGEQWSRMEYATVLRELGRIEAAEFEYRSLLAKNPGWFPALIGLAYCARQQRDLPLATERFAAALAAAPEHRGARYDYASVLRERGLLAPAEAQFRMLLAEHPGWHAALLGMGQCARQRGDLPAAAEWLAGAAAAAPPGDSWPRLDHATVLRELGRADEAEAVYRAVLADAPGSPPAMVGLGLCARLRNDRPTALAMFQSAAESAPDPMPAWLEMLTEHVDAGRIDAARALAGTILQRDPAAAAAWVGLGRIERLAGDRAAALEAFRQGAARCPDMPYFLVEMAIEAQAQGRFADAEQWLLRAAEVDATAGWALTQLGDNARAAQRPEVALDLLRRATARPDAPVGAHVSLAQLLAEIGQFDDALAVLDAAQGRLGPRPELATMRAGLLRRAGYRIEALAVARTASATAPDDMQLWQERFENERFSGTLEGLDAVLDAIPAGTQRERACKHYACGLLAEQRWTLGAAAEEYRRAIDLGLGGEWVHQALARVSLLQFDIASTRKHLLANVRLDHLTRQMQTSLLRITETHLGQLLEEFMANAPTLAALTEVQSLPPEARIARLLPLARDFPDQTSAAVALLIALRQAGWLDHTPTGPMEPARIPRRIVQYWNQHTPPPDIANLMQSWRDQNPHHEYLRFDHVAAQTFLAERCAPDVLLAYNRAVLPAKRADLFRLAYLAREGGVYADADDRCLRPLAAFVPPHADCVVHQEEYGTLGNNFIAVSPSHPVIEHALSQAVLSVNRGDLDLLWLATGPGVLTRSVAQWLAADASALPAVLARIAVLQRHELAYGVAVQCLASYKATADNWFRAAFAAPAAARSPAGALQVA